MSEKEILRRHLESCNYRNLQQKSKSMDLPSNYKKIYLIQLICARRFGTQIEIDEIIKKVKMERLQLSQSKQIQRKRKLQGAEISSTSNTCQSPPITLTPTRPSHMIISCGQDLHKALVKYQPNKSLYSRPLRTYESPDHRQNKYNRVLRSRSININNVEQPLQKILKCNPRLNIVKVKHQVTDRYTETDGKMKKPVTMRNEGSLLRSDDSSMIKRYKPIILSPPRQLSIKPKVTETPSLSLLQMSRTLEPYPNPLKRQRRLSGIYPITSSNASSSTVEYVQSIEFRRSDGKISKINAVVQKSKANVVPNERSVEVTIQDIINYNVNEKLTESNLSDFYLNEQTNLASTENIPLTDINYNNVIPAYWVPTCKSEPNEPKERLPKISDVFSSFNGNYRSEITQPLFVQVTDESERVPGSMLETIYTIRREFLTTQPLIITTNNTKCVYTTPIRVSAVIHQTNAINSSINDSVLLDNQFSFSLYNDLPRFYEQEAAARRQYEEMNGLDTNQDLGANVTIPDMVEDALEIISQDGDYMERIGMDIRMQCILCSWAGPKIILENHIRNVHANEIIKSENGTWNISIPLVSVIKSDVWSSRVLQLGEALYVISVNYTRPDTLAISLAVLTSESNTQNGSVTTYNKITGEPFTWTGPIQQIPTDLPYNNKLDCLNISMSDIEILPNSANLTFFNGKLVPKSPSKVVVGNIDLDHVTFILFVNIFD